MSRSDSATECPLLSILIPTFNDDASQLVYALRNLALSEGITHEIVVGDDASATRMEWVEKVVALDGVRTVRPDHNLGRAAIRNLMADNAHGQWLLFVDSDALVEGDFSLLAYLLAGQQEAVVCGGLRHPDKNPNPAATLRYKYERKADKHRSAAHRARTPYHQLSTFNLLIRKDVFEKIGGFDSNCKEYGYEDVLLGAILKQFGIGILHIDNPLVHSGLDSNADFIAKTEASLRTLQRMREKMQGLSAIDNMASHIRALGLTPIVRRMFRWNRGFLRHNLLGDHPSLFLFNCYKLGYYVSLPPDSSS